MPYFLLNHGPGGPLIDIAVSVSTPRAKVLKAGGSEVPPAVFVKALVDTGASHTMIDQSIPKQLGITPTGTVAMVTPSTGDKPVEMSSFDVGVHIPCGTQLAWSKPIWIATCADLSHQGFSVLLGRDILAESLLVYDGKHGTFTLSF